VTYWVIINILECDIFVCDSFVDNSFAYRVQLNRFWPIFCIRTGIDPVYETWYFINSLLFEHEAVDKAHEENYSEALECGLLFPVCSNRPSATDRISKVSLRKELRI
jgi:hypothetical protein